MLNAKGWKERKTQLGASEVSKIFNFNNKGAKDLWREKIGELARREFSNKYTVAGSLIEDEALKFYFNANHITDYVINKRVEHKEIKGLVASCDAVASLDNFTNTPVENKTMQFNKFVELTSKNISRNHIIQVQTQIACCDSPFGVIVFNGIEEDEYEHPLLYNPNHLKQISFNIKRDDKMVKEIESRAKYFLWCVKYKREPTEKEYKLRSVNDGGVV